MLNLKQKLPFLGNIGFFYDANKKVLENNSLTLLKECYDKRLNQGDLLGAELLAQKISILYGLEGLILFLTTKLERLKMDLREHELIDQDLIKGLAFVLFVQQSDLTEEEHKQILSLKQSYIELCSEKANKILEESTILAQFFESSFQANSYSQPADYLEAPVAKTNFFP